MTLTDVEITENESFDPIKPKYIITFGEWKMSINTALVGSGERDHETFGQKKVSILSDIVEFFFWNRDSSVLTELH